MFLRLIHVDEAVFVVTCKLTSVICHPLCVEIGQLTESVQRSFSAEAFCTMSNGATCGCVLAYQEDDRCELRPEDHQATSLQLEGRKQRGQECRDDFPGRCSSSCAKTLDHRRCKVAAQCFTQGHLRQCQTIFHGAVFAV